MYNPKILGHYPKIINSLTKSKSVLFYFDQTILNKGSSKIKGFEIFKDGVFVANTEAQLLDDKTVAVLNSSIDYPIEIRYLWKDAPSEVSIYNNIKKPLPPFRKTINN